MPWRVTGRMQERCSFIRDWISGQSVTGLCLVYGVSRKTGHKWICRFKEEGYPGLEDGSRARLTQALATDAATEALIVDARERHASWGPKKLRAWLRVEHPGHAFPAPSTLGEILKRRGLVRPRRRVRRLSCEGTGTVPVTGCNDLWNADFKGQFRLGNGAYCYPLTVTDTHSRYLLGCEALPGTGSEGAARVFRGLFESHGVPLAIRTDNGVPFASVGGGRLSRLSVLWLLQGIALVRINPGRPQENGSHERMHRTLKAETTRPPELTAERQQRRFDRFREEYNGERPHEALGQVTPASVYVPSRGAYQPCPREPEYPGHWEVRRVNRLGEVKFKGCTYFVSEALCGQPVGLRETEEDVWRLEFCGHPVAEIQTDRKILIAVGGAAAGGSRGRRYKKPSVSPM